MSPKPENLPAPQSQERHEERMADRARHRAQVASRMMEKAASRFDETMLNENQLKRLEQIRLAISELKSELGQE